MLKYELQKIVTVQDWDKLVQTTYNRPYKFQQQDGCKSRGTYNITIPGYSEDYENDSVPEEINGDDMGVSFEAWLNRDITEWNGDPSDESFLHLFWERNFYPDVHTLANNLYSKGLIEAGDYVIKIDW